ncbi:tail protein [Stenotrophomonas phage Pokken]|uniref:Tail fiber protein n=1 Tax=Stenotrophomonas phage Pokken TaxID=2596674 RepID=A0A5B9NCS5_9CAUD|nr:tail protein [Stenotrophomonas phage Pokken]QEG09281.1 hypothetical protein CPT_Pokken_063 [Stenotrophomonas phage Pokken]
MADLTPKAFDGMVLQLEAVALKGNTGEQGAPGTTGSPGKSNYQLWLEDGNVGTIEDFLATTKGEKGDQGDSLTNRGDWKMDTYKPGDFVFAARSAVDSQRTLWFLKGDEIYLSTVAPFNEPEMWGMLDIIAGISDAPTDGKQYARKNGEWVEVVSGGDIARVLTLNDATTIDPFTKYAEWEALYGFAADSSDWGSTWNVDDVAAVAFSGARAGADSPAICISSEGQVGWDYSGNPSGGSTAMPVLPPDTSRAYWNPNPRPWLLQSFHPVGQDCEGVGMLGHAIRGVGLIFKGFIRVRSTTNGCYFAMRFIGGTMELYLKSVGIASNYVMCDVSGNDSTPVFTRKLPTKQILSGQLLEVHWAPAP